jgi:hypothetical protein
MLEEGLLVAMEESAVTDEQVDPDSPCQFDCHSGAAPAEPAAAPAGPGMPGDSR